MPGHITRSSAMAGKVRLGQPLVGKGMRVARCRCQTCSGHPARTDGGWAAVFRPPPLEVPDQVRLQKQ